MTYNEHKIREFKGDALAKFLACEILIKEYETDQKKLQSLVVKAVCNRTFHEAALRLELKPHKDHIPFRNPCKDNFDKSYANAFEVKLYEVYEEHGLSGATLFFKTSIMPIISKL